MSGRPHDRELEAAVLGRVLLRNDEFNEVVLHVVEDDFHVPQHQAVFRAMAKLADRGEAIDMLTLERQLRASDQLQLVGGLQGLSELTGKGVGLSGKHIQHLAALGQAGRVWSAARELVDGDEARAILSDPDAWVMDATSRLTAALDRVEQGGPEQVDLAEAVHEVKRRRRGGGTRGIPTGFATLDRGTSGMHGGEVIVIGARVRVGKSALAMSVAENVAKEGVPVLVFSLEMSRLQQHMRLLAAEARVDLAKLNSGAISDEDEDALEAVAKRERLPLWIDDDAGLTVQRIMARFRGWRRRLGATRCVVMVDYVQLIEGVRERGENREQEVARITRTLKRFARREKVPVIELAQLNRGADKDDRPRLAHLRESGSIEADADVVWLIHRPECEAKAEDKAKLKGLAELIVAKQRNGPEFTVRMHYDGPRTRFDEARSAKEEET